ncbi:hypothetical protein TSAR_007471 [Trichomalopsis sarcophagae]|uniref:SUN domain-containing protein n=1 Tax=Trichomalopsis sarcophagae TaxID=543379 RepID=A0A232EG81_9HYME|nr:hypothetical protein TSAR_007471 [Trichomalopsis sarcophagae]
MLFSLAGITSEQQTPFVEPSEVSRLMSAVSFGYGIFQLGVSLLPPSLLKVIHLLGFEGDRKAGLTALMYSRLSEDMRAPLATLALLWYHTIVRPFFALDGSNVKAGVETAKELIAECQPEFENSALFLFFTGRIERLQSNVNGALRAYEKAVEMSTQREVKLLCLHEVAWCHLIRLNYGGAHSSLSKLQEESRWSKSFYAYLAAVCSGAEGDLETLLLSHKKLGQLVAGTTRETQLGLFISRRAPKLVDQETGRACSASYYKLLLGDREASTRCYRNCLKRRLPSNDSLDQHVSAFALYELGSALCSGSYTYNPQPPAPSLTRQYLRFLQSIEEGRCILQRAQSQYKEYDFESRLNVRIHAALKKVSKLPCTIEPLPEDGLVLQIHQTFLLFRRVNHAGNRFHLIVIDESIALSALSMSHLCEKYSSDNSFRTIKSDLSTLRSTVSMLSNEVRTLMETKDEFKSKLKEVVCVMPKLSDAIHHLRTQVSEGIDTHTQKLLDALSPDNVKKMVKKELEIYDADKTGRIDFALESAGGLILSTRDTETYPACGQTMKLLRLSVCRQDNSPRAIIQVEFLSSMPRTGVLPGECWSFKGSEGAVVIQLLGHVLISGFSLEHISPKVSITGETSNAPRDFSVWGLKNVDDRNGYLLGKYAYDNSGPLIQYYEVQNKPTKAFNIVELKIHSNQGNQICTCVYRIRVHGTLRSHELDYVNFR